MSKTTTKTRVPKLRFPEFLDTREWEFKPLIDICDVKGGKRIPKGYSLTTEKTEFPYVRVSDMYMGGVNVTSVLYISKEIEKTIKNYKISKDDLFITVAGTIGIIGEIPVELDNANLTENANKIVIKDVVKKYLLQYLISGFAQKLIASSITNNAQPKLALERIRNFPIPIPSPSEQQKIADCLSSIDELIIAHTQRHDALKAHKKGLMQQLFPAEGETVPKLRFPEFRNTEEWEEKEVGDVFDVTRGYVLSMNLVKDEWTEEAPYPVFSSQTKNNGLAGYYSGFLYENAITWTTDGANAGDVNYRAGKFYCTNVCGVLINTGGYANPFTAALINSVSKNHVSYVGNPKLMNGVMSKIVVPFPPLEEQQKIADCLSSIDELVTTQSKKIDALKTHKKGLMQQFFPSADEVNG